MDQNNTEPTLELLIGRPGPPPLRVHHIMAATAVTAVLLTLGKSLHQVAGVSVSGSFESPAGAFRAVLLGIALTLIGFGFAWRRTGYVFPSQPGHWLLFNTAVALIFYVVVGLTLLLTWGGWQLLPAVIFSGNSLLSLIAVIAINTMAARQTKDSHAWRVYFVARAVLFLAMQFVPIVLFRLLDIRTAGISSYLMSSLIVSFFILAAIGTDFWAGRNRDWVHWVGVALTLLNIVVGVISATVQLWIGP